MIFHDRNSGIPLAVSAEQAAAREALGKAIAEALTEDVLDSVNAFITPKKETPEERAERESKNKPLRCMVALTIPMPALTIRVDGGESMQTEPFTINANAPLSTGERKAVEKVGPTTGQSITKEALTALIRGQRPAAHK
jgi:hypothetical protein